MSEERAAPPSAAEAMYGPDGPIGGGPSDPRTREIIESGIAKPANPGLFAEERPSPRTERNGSASQDPHAPGDQAPEGYDTFLKKEDKCIKVVLKPNSLMEAA